MTVWIYINSAKEVGDEDHLKVFAIQQYCLTGSHRKRSLR
jgi:hypothetical protein